MPTHIMNLRIWIVMIATASQMILIPTRMKPAIMILTEMIQQILNLIRNKTIQTAMPIQMRILMRNQMKVSLRRLTLQKSSGTAKKLKLRFRVTTSGPTL